MYTISFRIPVGEFAGTRIYINGSASSGRERSGKVFVSPAGKISPVYEAEVVESVMTGRDPSTYKWDLP